MSQFINFNLDGKLLTTLEEIGYKTPTSIQEQAIPKVLEGSDIIACAQTGTGKTAAFLLPILHRLCSQRTQGLGPQILVLVPTRELAIQVSDEAKKFSKHLPQIKTVCIYGGVPYPVQKRALSKRCDILVATPGRLIDHMERGRIDLSKLQVLVLDEADRMLDMGFIEPIEQIAAATPNTRQTLLFSATIDKKILPFSRKLQNNPFEIRVEVSLATQNPIEQVLYYVDNIDHKIKLLEHLLENAQIHQSIVFTSTKRQADELANILWEKGYQAGAIHGDMNQRQRTRTIDKMRSGHIHVLVATDVAARGIDITSLSHVINFDLPHNPEDFIHRIGRTGRAGAEGTAITFATYKEKRWLTQIFSLLKAPIAAQTVSGLEPKSKESSGPGASRPRPRGGFGTGFKKTNGEQKRPWKKNGPPKAKKFGVR